MYDIVHNLLQLHVKEHYMEAEDNMHHPDIPPDARISFRAHVSDLREEAAP